MSFCKADKEPKYCAECGKITKFNYYKGEYNKYCPEHYKLSLREKSLELMKEGKLPLDFGWKKGLTKKDHPGIASQAQKVSGENNVFFGKKLSEESKKKRAETLALSRVRLLSEEKFNSRLTRKDIVFIGEYADYIGVQKNTLNFKCGVCNFEFKTCLREYQDGIRCPKCADNPSTRPEVKEKISATLRLPREEYNKRINENNNSDFQVLEPYENYIRQKDQKLQVRCKICGDNTTRTLAQVNDATQCHICHPDSKEEQGLKKFIDSLGIKYIANDRILIYPNEVDIIIPEHKIAIEYNGLYWHCENKKKDHYHLNKTNKCQKKGYTLIHVFSDEYFNKPQIVESMIRHKVHMDGVKIPARKCELKETSQEEQKKFFEQNHINGEDKRSVVCFGLYFQNVLVCAISLRVPFNKKYKSLLENQRYNKSIEIARYACSLNTTVQGGFSKLINRIKPWAKDNNYSKIITYVDVRSYFGAYEKVGFNKEFQTDVDYWYTDGKVRYSRFNFPVKGEQRKKFYKIFGCGSILYSMEIN